MNTQSRPSSGKTSSGGPPPLVTRLLIAAAVFLAVAFLLYWLGLSKGRGEMASQKTSYEGQLKTAQSQTADAQAQLAAAQTQNQLMTARGLLYQAALALDQRNFGIANDDVAKAGQTLEAAKPADAGVEGKLVPIRQAVTATKINVAEDLDTQRSGLLNLASQVDGLTQ